MKNLQVGVRSIGPPMTHHDPAAMAPAERLAEVARILAAAFRRLAVDRLESGQNPLDDLRAESPHVNTTESTEEAA